MAPRTFPLVKLTAKAGLAGGALYLVYSQGLLGSSDKGAHALHKAKAAVTPAVEEWTKYFGWQLPAVPKTEFSLCDAWNSGVRTVISALSIAPTKGCEYTQQGWKYIKELAK
ncbi:MICOS complex subunit MIC13 [Notechis scutatus]|uniref:MICOS complex subunit MIC13 n=1 Tax=Notechis scutatus TaxID=8663 RepID=A0A6J1W160_9SAUR|nr:MICOS complex subunit MIC13 [Notechis scutatus]